MYITRDTVHLVSVIYIRLRKDFIMFNIRNISKSSLKYVLLGGGIIIAAAASVIIFCIIGDKSKSDITPISETAYMTIESSGYMAEETSAAGETTNISNTSESSVENISFSDEKTDETTEAAATTYHENENIKIAESTKNTVSDNETTAIQSRTEKPAETWVSETKTYPSLNFSTVETTAAAPSTSPVESEAATSSENTTTSSGSDMISISIANSSAYRAYYEEVLLYTNEIRSAAGVSPLVLDDSLCNAASMRSLEMDYAQNMSHTRPDGTSFYTVFKEFNISYRYSGENIAWGYTSPKSVVEAWKNSPSHYENMISSKFTKLGVGYSQNSKSPYWTQLFTD